MVAHKDFFDVKRLPAVLKHGILSRYPTTFFAMTGSNSSTKGRGVYFDAFAGPGLYADGQIGSPVIASRMANSIARLDRDVRCVFVEKDQGYATKLQQALTEADPDQRCLVLRGDATDHIDTVMSLANGVPLLSLVDPWGTGLGYDVFTGELLRRRQGVPTELILNFNVEMVARAGGQNKDSNRTWLHQYLGGNWWLEYFTGYIKGTTPTAGERADQVAFDYFGRICAASGTHCLAVPIQRRTGSRPFFWLALFHDSPYAEWKFIDAVSKAQSERREAEYFAVSNEGLLEIFQPTKEDFLKSERELDSQLTETITSNLKGLLTSRPGPIPLLYEASTIYKDVLGEARSMHVNRALKRLSAEGLIAEQPGVATYKRHLQHSHTRR